MKGMSQSVSGSSVLIFFYLNITMSLFQLVLPRLMGDCRGLLDLPLVKTTADAGIQ